MLPFGGSHIIGCCGGDRACRRWRRLGCHLDGNRRVCVVGKPWMGRGSHAVDLLCFDTWRHGSRQPDLGCCRAEPGIRRCCSGAVTGCGGGKAAAHRALGRIGSRGRRLHPPELPVTLRPRSGPIVVKIGFDPRSQHCAACVKAGGFRAAPTRAIGRCSEIFRTPLCGPKTFRTPTLTDYLRLNYRLTVAGRKLDEHLLQAGEALPHVAFDRAVDQPRVWRRSPALALRFASLKDVGLPEFARDAGGMQNREDAKVIVPVLTPTRGALSKPSCSPTSRPAGRNVLFAYRRC